MKNKKIELFGENIINKKAIKKMSMKQLKRVAKILKNIKI